MERKRGRPRKAAVVIASADPEPAAAEGLQETDSSPIFTKQRNRVRDAINKLRPCEQNLLLLYNLERILKQSQA